MWTILYLPVVEIKPIHIDNRAQFRFIHKPRVEKARASEEALHLAVETIRVVAVYHITSVGLASQFWG